VMLLYRRRAAQLHALHPRLFLLMFSEIRTKRPCANVMPPGDLVANRCLGKAVMQF
jgi:hypothetical protein